MHQLYFFLFPGNGLKNRNIQIMYIPLFSGDSFGKQNGYRFTTRDNDLDIYTKNCAQVYKGAWWYSKCHSCNLNGQYLGGPHSSNADGIEWNAWKGQNYSLKKTQMKIRPKQY